MPDARLPIKVLRIPGGAVVRATGERLYIRGRDSEGATHAMTLDEAEQLAEDVARALTEAWTEDDVRTAVQKSSTVAAG
jgi:hypothetical protein